MPKQFFKTPIEGTRDTVIDEIKRYFCEDPDAFAKFPFSENVDTTKISISDGYPYEERKLPGIFVRALPGSSQEVGLSQAMGVRLEKNQAGDITGEFKQFGTHVPMTVELVIAAWDTVTRDKVWDLLFSGLVKPIREALQSRGIDPTRPYVRFGGQFDEKFTERRWIHGFTMSYPVMTQWYDEEGTEDEIENLEDFDLTGIEVFPSCDINGGPIQQP